MMIDTSKGVLNPVDELKAFLRSVLISQVFRSSGSLVSWYGAITPLLSAALSTRGEDMRMSDQIVALQKKGDWAGIAKLAQDKLLRDPTHADSWVLLGYALEWAFYSYLYQREHLQQQIAEQRHAHRIRR